MACSWRTFIHAGGVRGLNGKLLAMALGGVSSLSAALVREDLPPLPDEHGFAGAFAGVTQDALIVAGGANFPEGLPWEGGSKVWHDPIFLLDKVGSWQVVGTLPKPLGYGTSVSTQDGVLCVGGGDAMSHAADCFFLTREGGKILPQPAPSLPVPLAFHAAVELDGVVYVCGGIRTPAATEAEKSLYALDLNALEKGWQTLEPLPAAGRILSVAAARNGAFYLASGASLAADVEGRAVRTYLRELWKYQPGKGWSREEDLPRAAVAAPSPALNFGASHFAIWGGDDGTKVGLEPLSAHPGFDGSLLLYDTVTARWTSREGPGGVRSPVTTPVVVWGQRFVIPTGEVRPGVRSPQVVALRWEKEGRSFGGLNWTIVALYLAGMLVVGWWFMRRQSAATTEAYFRGGQRVPSWVAGLSIFATMLSSLTFMGIPARVYQTDASWYLGQIPILLVVPLVVCFYLPFFRKLDLTSAYQYLEKRFNAACRVFAAVSFMLFHLGRIAIVLYLPALALAAVSDIGVVTAILIIGVLCVIYTVMGGIEAVVWTDAIQAIVLMGGAVLCFGLAASRVDGGLAGMATIASEDAKLFQNVQWTSFDWSDGTMSAVVLFVAFFFNSLVPYTSSQDVVQRYVTTRDLSAAKKSLQVTMWMSLLGSLLFFALGVAIYAFYKTHPAALDPGMGKTDSILPFYIMRELPVGVSGLVIAAIFAASQSTVSSSLNSVATSFVTDIDARFLRKGREDASYLRSAQGVVVVAGLLGIFFAVWMARADIESAFKTFNSLIGLTAGSLGGLFALGVFSKRAHGTGAFVGAVAGLATVMALSLGDAPVTGLLYSLIGFVVCALIGWVASLILPGQGAGEWSIRGNQKS